MSLYRFASFLFLISSVFAEPVWRVPKNSFKANVVQQEIVGVVPNAWFLVKTLPGQSFWPTSSELERLDTVKLTPQVELVGDKLISQNSDLYYFAELGGHRAFDDKFLNDDLILYAEADEGSILELIVNEKSLLKSQESISFPLSILKGIEGSLCLKVMTAGLRTQAF